MSYAQAMKFASKHPKGIKQAYMGFNTDSGPWPSGWSNPVIVVSNWFKNRHNGNAQYNRECIREQIKEAREKQQNKEQTK